MARRKAVILKPKTWAILARIIRDYLAGRLTNRPPKGDEPKGRRAGRLRVKRGLLTSDIAAAASFLAAPETGTGQPYKPDATTDIPGVDGDPIDLVNYHPTLSGVIGDYFVAIWLDGAWNVIDIQCPVGA